jgi:aspartate racemase
MKTVGLVGGLGPEATIDYYKRLFAAWERDHPGSAPAMMIDSLDYHRGLKLVANDLPGVTEYLLGSVERLARAGVDFVALTANTAHITFDDLAKRASVPLLSIVEVCADEAQSRGIKRPLLLGTRFTMEAAFYPQVFERRGITIVRPPADDRTWVHDCYVNELMRGTFRDDRRAQFGALVNRLRASERIDGVILGGTELPLLLTRPVMDGLPVLDTTALHVEAIVRRLGES